MHRVWSCLFVFLFAMAGACGSDKDADGDPCQPDDADGVNGDNTGSRTFDVTVDDSGFSPAIIPVQNVTSVTLTLHNAGTKPHDLVVDCMGTPNDNGCPMSSCFPTEANIAPLDPGASAMTTFVTPNPEGIYYYYSDLPGDADTPCMAGARGCGQFKIQ